MSKKQKNVRRDKLVKIAAACPAVIALLFFILYFFVNRTPQYQTYSADTTPFTFSYPSHWQFNTSSDSKKLDGLTLTKLTAKNTKENADVLAIEYHSYNKDAPSVATGFSPDCEHKQGKDLDQCQYIENSAMKHGYLYHIKNTDNWYGKVVGDKYETALTITLLQKTPSAEDELVKLAESLRLR